MKPTSVLVACLLASVALGGCSRERSANVDSQPTPITAGTVARGMQIGSMGNVDVSGDKAVLVVAGNERVKRPIVHLHGMCGAAKDDLDAFGAAVAKEHGTIIAVTGDVPCNDQPGLFQWSQDAEKLDARISAAIDAVNAARSLSLDKSDVVVIGESMGAARAESLAAKKPERYGRLVLVGSPQSPSPQNLGKVKAVANVAAEKEPQGTMKNGAKALAAAGLASQFWELPGATHGEYGPDGGRVMAEAVAFVAAK